ncbi:hypothetical protein ARMGADRAFT_459595 [Armillaria gallica]|uniref:Uncharacterized protein n=1 Tax=Armillaria gallica TaxID=47427 RepID=A0A2H3CWZ5_ARMGA|nr:hypothetical protein ARMGADRAFT_459595 [Armillaria gallica]
MLRNLSGYSPAVPWISISLTVAMTDFVGAYSTVTSVLAFDIAIETIDINTVHHSTNLASELDDTSFTRSAGLRWGRDHCRYIVRASWYNDNSFVVD